MKNISLTILLFVLLLPSVSNGQLIEVGTKWTYDKNVFIPIGPMERTVQTITAVADTMIDGEKYLILEGGCDCSDAVHYIRTEDRRYYMHYDGAKHLLYDFNLGEGDVLAIRAPLGNADQDSVKVLIVGVSTIEHNGQTLKMQQVDSYFSDEYDFWADWGSIFVEGMGSTGYCFFPQYGLCEAGTGPLRCMEFADGTNVKLTDEPFCDEFTSITPWRVDSEWTYRQWGLPSNSTVVKFSIIDAGKTGKQLVRLTEDGEIMDGSEIDIWTEQDKVFYIDTDNQKRLMYDFSPSLAVGDTIEYWLPPNANMYDISSNGGMETISNPYRLIIEDIVMVVDVNGETLRKYIVDSWSLLDPNNPMPPCNLVNEYVENVGGLPGFIRMGCQQLTAGTGPEFRCFTDHIFEYKEVADGECLIVGTEDLIKEEVNVYPNPVTDFLFVETAASLSEIKIYDSMGRLVMKPVASEKVHIADLEPGVYMILLTDVLGRTNTTMVAKL